jgi:DnaJ like chaperone protein
MSIWSQLSLLARRAFEDDAAPGTDVTSLQCAPDPNDVEFTAAVVGLGAKLAKADGLVTIDEVAAFSRVFRAAPGDEPAMRRVFDIARQTVLGYESYARRIGKRYRDRPCLLEGVLDALFQIAASDGVVTGDEIAYLKSVSDLFEFSDDTFRRIKAAHLGQGRRRSLWNSGRSQRRALRGDSRRLPPADARKPPGHHGRRQVRPARVRARWRTRNRRR